MHQDALLLQHAQPLAEHDGLLQREGALLGNKGEGDDGSWPNQDRSVTGAK
jgi:hypothetical protein